MVDALREADRVLRPGGLLIDARPDSRLHAKLEHDGRIVGVIRTQAGECGDDRAADRAVAAVKRERLFRRVRAGRFWHRLPFADLPAFEGYLREHLRFEHRVRWTPSAMARKGGWRSDPVVLVRAVRFEMLERR